VSLIGFGEDEGDEIDHLANLRAEVVDTFEKMPKSQRLDDVAIQHAVRLCVRRLINDSFGRKPLTEVHVTRV
jgi:ribonuclease J